MGVECKLDAELSSDLTPIHVRLMVRYSNFTAYKTIRMIIFSLFFLSAFRVCIF